MLSWIWADGYHGKPGADYNGLIDAIFYDEAMPRGRIVETPMTLKTKMAVPYC